MLEGIALDRLRTFIAVDEGSFSAAAKAEVSNWSVPHHGRRMLGLSPRLIRLSPREVRNARSI
jgi:hypothetical protein